MNTMHRNETSANLSATEADIMRWLAAGKSNLEIATLRGRSPATVRNQLHRVYRKLGARTRGQAVQLWLANQSPAA
ncbi:MAG: helix-turn-helix transcriptional regulator [Vitreoscilla sp.]|nr:helix-turn-helix transcriptional regulator [Vitreoscilla sp.]